MPLYEDQLIQQQDEMHLIPYGEDLDFSLSQAVSRLILQFERLDVLDYYKHIQRQHPSTYNHPFSFNIHSIPFSNSRAKALLSPRVDFIISARNVCL